MARYTGPKQRINRKFAEPILGGNGKTLEKKGYPPGMHGMMKKEQSNRNIPCSCLKSKKQNIPMA